MQSVLLKSRFVGLKGVALQYFLIERRNTYDVYSTFLSPNIKALDSFTSINIFKRYLNEKYFNFFDMPSFPFIIFSNFSRKIYFVLQ